MIMPAQEPYAGMPSAIRLRIGSSRPNSTASLLIVVDSPPGIDQRVDVVELARAAHRPAPATPHSASAPQVLADVALQGQHADTGSRSMPAHQPRSARRCGAGMSSTLMPTIASPSPRDTLAITSGSS